jgi:hypothetical protein
MPANTPTAAPTATAIRTPPVLPPPYQSKYLDALDTPHRYENDSCRYLANKWGEGKSAAGTVVMVIMLHAINRGRPESQEAVNAAVFDRMMADLHSQKFQAIDTKQLADFLEENAVIPERSVLLVQDGRRYPGNFDSHFKKYWEAWGWPVVNAWDNQGNTTETLWAQQRALESEGFVDHQVYGPTFNPGSRSITAQSLSDQLEKPLQVFQERFDKRPIAVVWPSGFDKRAVQTARGLGYRLGFTLNPRGPLMYNWVPLADKADTMRPSYLPEGPIDDPLMTLPRYWAYQVHDALDQVRVIGKQASDIAEKNRVVELDYYDIVCAAKYGPLKPSGG